MTSRAILSTDIFATIQNPNSLYLYAQIDSFRVFTKQLGVSVYNLLVKSNAASSKIYHEKLIIRNALAFRISQRTR